MVVVMRVGLASLGKYVEVVVLPLNNKQQFLKYLAIHMMMFWIIVEVRWFGSSSCIFSLY